jgi:hypothetical protein
MPGDSALLVQSTTDGQYPLYKYRRLQAGEARQDFR